MTEHKASISWSRNATDFLGGKYSREHTWRFDGGAAIAASPSPSIVPSPFSNPASVDPEEAFVAAVSSCHMLLFLNLASKHGFQVDEYTDDAAGVMTKNEKGALWISAIKLNVRVTCSGRRLPTRQEEDHLHELAHEQCFIANSVRTHITCVHA